MSERMPALSLVAVPGRRRLTLELARDAERRGFSGLYVPSRYGNMAQCTGLALATGQIPFGTAIAPIYARTVEDFAHDAAYLHELSGGRFRFGIGIAHGPTYRRLGVSPGKPLSDIRAFVTKLRSYEGIGELPPLILAALRRKMVALAAEIGNGVVFANASLSHMPRSLAAMPEAKRNDPSFLIGNMLPVCVAQDVGAAKALLRRRLVHYALLPNYRAYWREAGYVEEMAAVETALAEGPRRRYPEILDRPLARRHHAVWAGGQGARRRRGLARGRCRHADPRPQLDRRQLDHRAAGAVRGLRRLMPSARDRAFASSGST
jgi:alkanesulfonate monooxygenase SsuD/methylene tetrahydromethanopterin reductase-like flavin-dependent oxidoreductase (luciferase family)